MVPARACVVEVAIRQGVDTSDLTCGVSVFAGIPLALSDADREAK
jgi:hypothetical protein